MEKAYDQPGPPKAPPSFEDQMAAAARSAKDVMGSIDAMGVGSIIERLDRRMGDGGADDWVVDATASDLSAISAAAREARNAIQNSMEGAEKYLSRLRRASAATEVSKPPPIRGEELAAKVITPEQILSAPGNMSDAIATRGDLIRSEEARVVEALEAAASRVAAITEVIGICQAAIDALSAPDGGTPTKI